MAMYEKTFKIRRAVKGKNTIITGIPIEFVKYWSKLNGMAVDEFLSKYEANASYDDCHDYLTYTFKRIFGV